MRFLTEDDIRKNAAKIFKKANSGFQASGLVFTIISDSENEPATGISLNLLFRDLLGRDKMVCFPMKELEMETLIEKVRENLKMLDEIKSIRAKRESDAKTNLYTGRGN